MTPHPLLPLRLHPSLTTIHFLVIRFESLHLHSESLTPNSLPLPAFAPSLFTRHSSHVSRLSFLCCVYFSVFDQPILNSHLTLTLHSRFHISYPPSRSTPHTLSLYTLSLQTPHGRNASHSLHALRSSFHCIAHRTHSLLCPSSPFSLPHTHALHPAGSLIRSYSLFTL